METQNISENSALIEHLNTNIVDEKSTDYTNQKANSLIDAPKTTSSRLDKPFLDQFKEIIELQAEAFRYTFTRENIPLMLR